MAEDIKRSEMDNLELNLNVINTTMEFLLKKISLCEKNDKVNLLLKSIQDKTQKIKEKIRENIYQYQMKTSRTLQILSKIHGKEVLDYEDFSINWAIWDQYIDKIIIIFPKINNKSNNKNKNLLDRLLCIFIWSSFDGAKYYNKNLRKKNEPELPLINGGDKEFFIILDGYNKKSFNVPILLILSILNKTLIPNLYLLNKALYFVVNKRLRLIKCKELEPGKCYGLKVELFDDFSAIKYPDEPINQCIFYIIDWIECGKKNNFLLDYKN